MAPVGGCESSRYLVRMLPAPEGYSSQETQTRSQKWDHLQGREGGHPWQGGQTRRRQGDEGEGTGWRGRPKVSSRGGAPRDRGTEETGWVAGPAGLLCSHRLLLCSPGTVQILGMFHPVALGAVTP